MAVESRRRSSRRSKKRGTVAYSVGDLVEIAGTTTKNPGGTATKGWLVAKVSDDTAGESATKRWVVNIESPNKGTPIQEEIDELDLGEVVGKVEVAMNDAPSKRNRGTYSTRKAKNTKPPKEPPQVVSPESKHVVVSVSTRRESKTIKKQQQEIELELPAAVETTASTTDESVATEVHDNKRSAAASAREERSKRRQAQFEATVEAHRPAKKTKHSKHENVVRIPMLTGTLVLHRGSSRRAEFIRKF